MGIKNRDDGPYSLRQRVLRLRSSSFKALGSSMDLIVDLDTDLVLLYKENKT